MKKYILIAGVNGAGKSTLYQSLDSLKEMKRINTDEIVRNFGDWKNPADVLKAGKIALHYISEAFEKGESFNQETTLCGHNIVDNIRKAKELGYEIELHYVGVDSVDIAKERIAHRVANGGHGVPDKDVERRYVQSLKRLKELLTLCATVVLSDNTIKFDRFAMYHKGKLENIANYCPEWYRSYFMD